MGVTEELLVQGALIETILGEEQGLKFADGRHSKPKKMIIVGIDKTNRCCYGTVLINTKINSLANLSQEFLDSQYILKQEKYPKFLRYDSYVDCAMIFPIPFSILESGRYFGTLAEEDFEIILNILETTTVLSTKDKKRYGIRRR